jgi:hypothetical protein
MYLFRITCELIHPGSHPLHITIRISVWRDKHIGNCFKTNISMTMQAQFPCTSRNTSSSRNSRVFKARQIACPGPLCPHSYVLTRNDFSSYWRCPYHTTRCENTNASSINQYIISLTNTRTSERWHFNDDEQDLDCTLFKDDVSTEIIIWCRVVKSNNRCRWNSREKK